MVTETLPFGTLFFDVMAGVLVCFFGWKCTLLMRTAFFAFDSVTFGLPTTLYLIMINPVGFVVVYPIHLVTVMASYVAVRRFFQHS